jgi:hypothetical protein
LHDPTTIPFEFIMSKTILFIHGAWPMLEGGVPELRTAPDPQLGKLTFRGHR